MGQKIIEVDKERIMKKIGEIKSFEKQGLEFFKSGMSILCSEDFSVGPMERKIVTFKMPELDMFSSELAGRKILIKERDNDKRILTIFKQTANVIVNERKSEVDVLVQNERNKECTVKASDKGAGIIILDIKDYMMACYNHLLENQPNQLEEDPKRYYKNKLILH